MNRTYDQNTIANAPEIINYLTETGAETIKRELMDGLRTRQKMISPKFFYDKAGSELFEEITHLPEYYPTRSEKEILLSLTYNLDTDFHDLNIIELASGDSSKISLIMQQLSPEILSTISYIPIDISLSALEKSTAEINENFYLKEITGIVADIHSGSFMTERNGRNLFLFPGSTIGNFSKTERENFMLTIGKTMKKGDLFLLGADLIKATGIIEKAYNDERGVTEKFNKNILNAVNSKLNTNFDPNDFNHRAFYNQEKKRVEMHLEARRDLSISINSRPFIALKKGETIHTENSYKFDREIFDDLAGFTGLTIKDVLFDKNKWFSIVVFEK